MIIIKNAQDIFGKTHELTIHSEQNVIFDAKGLTLFPGLIDPHVHFRVPGHEYKEDWMTAAKAALCGGYTTVFDMPNTDPTTVNYERLQQKKQLIDQQLEKIDIPLRYHLYLGADRNHFDQFAACKGAIIGIKIFMGCSTGDLLMSDDSSLHAAFALAAQHDLVVAVHAEDEAMIHQRQAQFKPGPTDYLLHSTVRDPSVAATAVARAIKLTRLYNNKLYILHTSSRDEIQLIRAAKDEGLAVYAETTPHHLFLNTDAYAQLHGKAQMNPPLRSHIHQLALFEAIHDGTIDTIGSDHAPHTVMEKSQAYGACPSGVPGIETMLPLLLTAYHEQKLTLAEIIGLTATRAQFIFNLAPNDDVVLVDLNKEKLVQDTDLKTKCAWSPFTGRILKGWPVAVVLRNRFYDVPNLSS